MDSKKSQPIEMQQRFDLLPQEIKELFTYDTVGYVVDSLGREFGLNETQQRLLLMEIELVLYFFAPQEGFKQRLQESLEIEEKPAKELAERVESELFVIVKPALQLADKLFKGESVAGAEPAKPFIPSIATPKEEPPKAPIEPKPQESAGLQKVRTFADDVSKNRPQNNASSTDTNGEETIHSSSQDDIISR